MAPTSSRSRALSGPEWSIPDDPLSSVFAALQWDAEHALY